MTENKNLTCIPSEFLPECWQDKARLNVLFAPLRNQHANPHDWNSKIAFWRKMIDLYCEHSKVYKFTTGHLFKAFSHDGRSPACLEEVINEMIKLKEIQPSDQYLEAPAKTWTEWATQVFVKKPMKWTYRTVRESFIDRDKNQEFVHLESIDKAAKELVNNIPENIKSKVIDLDTLIHVLNWPRDNIIGLQLIIHKLFCSGFIDLRDHSNVNNTKNPLKMTLIKMDTKSVKPISDLDISVYILEENEQIVMKTVEKLENEMDKIKEEAKECLKKKQRQIAKSLLSKKRKREEQLLKNTNALHNIQILLSNLKDVEYDSEVLASYKLALSSLQNTFKDKGLTEDAVADTMISLGDVLDIHEDIQTSLSKPLHDENLEELEEELNELVLSTNKSNEEEDKAIKDLEKKMKTTKDKELPSEKTTQLPLPTPLC